MSRLSSFSRAMELAHTIQWQGAPTLSFCGFIGISFEEYSMSQIPEAVIELPNWEQPAAWNEPILFEPLDTPEIPTHWLPGVLGEFAGSLGQRQ